MSPKSQSVTNIDNSPQLEGYSGLYKHSSSSSVSSISIFLCFFKNKNKKKKMFSKTVSVSASSLTTKGGDTFKSAFDGSSFSKLKSLSFSQKTRNFKVSATSIEADNFALTGVVFQPFEELKKDYLAVPIIPHVSMARQTYSDECEAAINEQINVEYNASYVYHALFAYFDRDNVALKGLAKFFKESSEEEREHAEKLMEYQNIRGGRVKLHSILMPPSDFEHVEKGDALYAMELTLSLEKLVNEKLLNLHSVIHLFVLL
ncbi:hypothetical protein EZV62_016719 [Acer yangbiense]|uniref:Ferritin n=1 Tax=Acer yangbiense TaxID=1000413 RepID=A0A5C7HP82_9ROSI|nr:hypothetical protein EZV62_016719 [Acer yangbiense]